MNYISDIFNRMNIQQIREFLLHGVECVEIDNRTYEQRIEESGKEMFNKLSSLIPKTDEQEKIENTIYDFVSVYQDVYMEIGIRAGITLVVQMFGNSTI